MSESKRPRSFQVRVIADATRGEIGEPNRCALTCALLDTYPDAVARVDYDGDPCGGGDFSNARAELEFFGEGQWRADLPASALEWVLDYDLEKYPAPLEVWLEFWRKPGDVVAWADEARS